MGTPLVASDGHRLGTLCFADAAPRKFDAERCNILNNMAELVVRELERAWALRQTRLEAAQMQQARALLPSGWQAGPCCLLARHSRLYLRPWLQEDGAPGASAGRLVWSDAGGASCSLPRFGAC